MNRLSITGTFLLTALCLLSTACNKAENEQMYTEKTLAANEQLKAAISQLKQGIKQADATSPATLTTIDEHKEAELKAIYDEETAILKENKILFDELDKSKAEHAELTAATQELEARFNKEREAAIKAKRKYNRNHEHLYK